jgi:hypothetical protein
MAYSEYYYVLFPFSFNILLLTSLRSLFTSSSFNIFLFRLLKYVQPQNTVPATTHADILNPVDALDAHRFCRKAFMLCAYGYIRLHVVNSKQWRNALLLLRSNWNKNLTYVRVCRSVYSTYTIGGSILISIHCDLLYCNYIII